MCVLGEALCGVCDVVWCGLVCGVRVMWGRVVCGVRVVWGIVVCVWVGELCEVEWCMCVQSVG